MLEHNVNLKSFLFPEMRLYLLIGYHCFGLASVTLDMAGHNLHGQTQVQSANNVLASI